MNLTDEVLIRVDDNDKVIGSVLRKELAKDPKVNIRIVVVSVYNKKGQMLFGIKNKRVNNPTWSVVGSGHVSLEEPLVAAVRELEEESGIKSTPEMLEYVHTRFDNDKGYGAFVYEYKLLLDKDFEELKGNEEFSSYKWMSIEELKNSNIPMSFGTTQLVRSLEA